MIKVKICGITNLEDAKVAAQAGADFLGFIFYEASPRYVTPEMVREIVSGVKCQVSGDGGQVSGTGGQQAKDLPHGSRVTNHTPPQFVGVFVNSPRETVGQILRFCRLDAAQLHGAESPEFVRHLDGRAFKALRPQSQDEAEALIQDYLPCSSAPRYPCFLLDAYHPTLYGGTGHVTDWTIAANIARQHPILLAGSLTPANVAEAIRTVQPWGVDVSSGVEAEKGRKDHEKVREFVKSVKSVIRDT